MNLILKYGPYVPKPIREVVKRLLPARLWLQATSIYPLHMPPLAIRPNLDVLLLELPQRYMPLVPVGVGYVASILSRMGLSYQVVDYNLQMYHAWHSKRILRGMPRCDGYQPPEDPWATISYPEWTKPDIVDYFAQDFNDLVDAIVKAAPKVLAVPLSETNHLVAGRIIRAVLLRLPQVNILVGGYDCVYPEVVPHVGVPYDNAVIGEAELVLPELLKAILHGKTVRDMAGVISVHDSPRRIFKPGPLLADVDKLTWPKYEWALPYYRSFQGATVVPIVASRGCVWGRCRFCAEAWQYRKRSPSNVIDEIEWFVKHGHNHFHFNDSDILGTHMLGICREVIRRKLKIIFHGQCRIQKDGTLEFYRILKEAGCYQLAFGVDGWSDRVAKLQNKGYTMATVANNLYRAHHAGIITAANMVIGVPGETEDDVSDCIRHIISMRGILDNLQNLNLLSLFVGSEYWREPEKYNIKFRRPLTEIIGQFHYFAPADLWYSENPYIDQPVREARRLRIYEAIKAAGAHLPDYAEWQVTGKVRPSHPFPDDRK